MASEREGPEDADEMVEVEVVEGDDEQVVLMQTSAHAGQNGPRLGQDPGNLESRAMMNLLLLRDQLEQRWLEGHEVRHVVATVDTREASLDLIRQVVKVIPWKMDECRRCGLPLSPAAQAWVNEVLEAIGQMVKVAGEEDEAVLMQRTLTGLVSSPAKNQASRAQELHAELTELQEEEATTLAMKLMQAVGPYQTAVAQWSDVHAVLVAHTGRKGAIHCGSRLAEQERWVTKWFEMLVKPEREQQTSTGEERASSSHETADQQLPAQGEPLEDQEDRLLEAQQVADEELFGWHQRELAREAQAQDRAALVAHMG